MNYSYLFLLSLFLLSSCTVETQTSPSESLIDPVEEQYHAQVEEQPLLEPTEENFLAIVKTNKDGKEFLEEFPQTQVVQIQQLTPALAQYMYNTTEFKAVFENLPNSSSLYFVEFTNQQSMNLLTVIDLEQKSVERIFGHLLIGMG